MEKAEKDWMRGQEIDPSIKPVECDSVVLRGQQNAALYFGGPLQSLSQSSQSKADQFWAARQSHHISNRAVPTALGTSPPGHFLSPTRFLIKRLLTCSLPLWYTAITYPPKLENHKCGIPCDELGESS